MMLSVDDEPESDEATRSGADGADGADESTSTGVADPVVDVLPAGSVSVPVTDQVPSDRDGRSHDDAEPTTYEQVFVVEPFVAVTVAVSPDEPPGTENDGVVSDVMLSVDDEPESDEATRSGADGADGADASTTSERPALAVDWFPAGSLNFAVSVHVPSVSPDTAHDVAEPTT